MIRHHFTVDVEEYFHPTAITGHFDAADWPRLERRSPEVIDRLLEFLSERDIQGTFFLLGWLAEQEPDMVRAISDAGHEIASHGYAHQIVGALGPSGFRESVRKSKRALESLSGRSVVGYRAPSFSIIPGLEWAFDILLEEGYRYDASLFPITQHPSYGYPTAGHDPFVIERPAGLLAEFPSTTARFLGRVVPAAGGAYFRILPYALVRRGLRQAQARAVPGTFYIHPWELDDWAPDVPGAPWVQMVRTFHGRGRTWRRMDRMFGEFRFGPVIDSVQSVMDGAERLSLGTP